MGLMRYGKCSSVLAQINNRPHQLLVLCGFECKYPFSQPSTHVHQGVCKSCGEKNLKVSGIMLSYSYFYMKIKTE